MFARRFLLTTILSGIMAPRVRKPNKHRTRMSWMSKLEALSSLEFRRSYRMSLVTFKKLLATLKPYLDSQQPQKARVSKPISAVLKLSMTIRYLAGGSYLDVYQHHGVSASSFYKIVRETTDIIDGVFTMRHPTDNPTMLAEIEGGFHEISKLDDGLMGGWVGAVDGISIRIRRPNRNEDDRPRRYFNRKQFFALNCQAIVDSRKRFREMAIDSPGSTHDAVAWIHSDLYRRIQAQGGLPCGYWIAGDAAYGCSAWMLCPYSGKRLDRRRDSFNFFLSRLCITVECSFGVLVNG